MALPGLGMTPDEAVAVFRGSEPGPGQPRRVTAPAWDARQIGAISKFTIGSDRITESTTYTSDTFRRRAFMVMGSPMLPWSNLNVTIQGFRGV
jgi:hypothetical protein